MNSNHEKEKQNLADAVIISGTVYTAQSADTLGKIDAAENMANESMANVADSYVNNTEASLAGFAAEAHHAGTYIINSALAGTGETASRLGSTEFASADVLTQEGGEFNPKYYATADGSADAFSTPFNDGGEIINKYHDQIGVMPSDQLSDAQQHIQDNITSAMGSGDFAEAHRLEGITLSDRITDSHGISSDPLSSAQAHEYAQSIQNGNIPTFGDGFNFFDTTGDIGVHAAEAATLTLAIDAASIFKDIFSGKIDKNESVNAIQDYWNERGQNLIVKAGSRSIIAGGLASTSYLDPTGAAVIVSAAFSIYENNKLLEQGLITKEEFLVTTTKSIALTGVTGLSSIVMGPYALLIPIATELAIKNIEAKKMVMRSFSDAFSSAQDATYAAAGTASMKTEMYNKTKETKRAWESAKDITSEIEEHQKRLEASKIEFRKNFFGQESKDKDK